MLCVYTFASCINVCIFPQKKKKEICVLPRTSDTINLKKKSLEQTKSIGLSLR